MKKSIFLTALIRCLILFILFVFILKVSIMPDSKVYGENAYGTPLNQESIQILNELNQTYPTIKEQVLILYQFYKQQVHFNRALKNLKHYLKSIHNPESLMAINKLLNERYFKSMNIPEKSKNYCLHLLMYMMDKSIFKEKDVISVALAFSNNYLFSIADEKTRKEILSDIEKHYHFYIKIIEWQNSNNLAFRLENAPFVAKVFWSDRFSYYFNDIYETTQRQNSGILSLPIYLEFVDKVSTLEDLFQIINNKRLFHVSVRNTVKKIDTAIYLLRKYRSTMDNLVDFNRRGAFSGEDLAQARREYANGEYETVFQGKKRVWDDFRWLNYQHSLLKRRGYYRGDCGGTTVIMMGYYRACGIASVSMQWIHPARIAAYNHNFPLYYHVTAKRWMSMQLPILIGNNGKPLDDSPLYLHCTKTIWHHWGFKFDWKQKIIGNYKAIVWEYYPGELSTLKRITNFLNLGVSKKHFDSLFFTNKTQEAGLFFNENSAPENIQDSDSDGVPDIIENELGLNVHSEDTDNDGYSDYWEIENGYDPGNSHSPGHLNIPAIDGIAPQNIENAGFITVYDPMNDYKAVKEIYDIKSVSAKIVEKNLYVVVQYHNDIRKNSLNLHSFMITVKGRKYEQYWIQWYKKELIHFRKMNGPDFKKWKTIEHQGMEMDTMREGEFLIPLSHFPSAESIYIQYYSGGISDTSGRIDAASDISEIIRLPLKPTDISFRLNEILKNTKKIIDPQNDNKIKNNSFDIKTFHLGLDNDYLVCYVNYHNDVSRTPFGYHTVWIRDREKKKNYWFQFMNLASAHLHVFLDGAQGKKVKIDDNSYNAFYFQNGYCFVIHKSIFENKRNVEIEYLVGGIAQNGIIEVNSDNTGKVLYNLN